jgi:hypothetical protein
MNCSHAGDPQKKQARWDRIWFGRHGARVKIHRRGSGGYTGAYVFGECEKNSFLAKTLSKMRIYGSTILSTIY